MKADWRKDAQGRWYDAQWNADRYTFNDDKTFDYVVWLDDGPTIYWDIVEEAARICSATTATFTVEGNAYHRGRIMGYCEVLAMACEKVPMMAEPFDAPTWFDIIGDFAADNYIDGRHVSDWTIEGEPIFD